MKIENVLVFEPYILAAIRGARRSWASEHKSDSELQPWDDGSWWLNIGPEDEKLCKKLLTGAVGEDKFMRAIPVSADITAPIYWWREADQYKVGTVSQSSSLMHTRRGRRIRFEWDDFTVDDQGDAYIREMVGLLNGAYTDWRESGQPANSTSPLWRRWQQMIPASFNYTRHWFGSYATLRNIYRQRRHHRLMEWREFCRWIETLPQSWLITYGTKSDQS